MLPALQFVLYKHLCKQLIMYTFSTSIIKQVGIVCEKHAIAKAHFCIILDIITPKPSNCTQQKCLHTNHRLPRKYLSYLGPSVQCMHEYMTYFASRLIFTHQLSIYTAVYLHIPSIKHARFTQSGLVSAIEQ